MTKTNTAQLDPASDKAAAEAWYASCLKRMKSVGRFADFAEINPAMAAVLLERNAHNRTMVSSGVREWSDALRRGDWQVNGEPIIVSDTGELNDGQHRLKAVMDTGIAIPTLIVFGVSRDSRKTVDTGKKRTSGHVLGMAGVSQASLTAASLKVLINLLGGHAVNTHRSAPEIERALGAHPDIRLSFPHGVKVARQFRQSTGLFSALHYVMAQRSRQQADQFFTLLADGTAPAKRHPTAVLRSRLTMNLANKAKLPIADVAALVIKAWNDFRAGRETNTLRWRTEGDAAEAFPKVR